MVADEQLLESWRGGDAAAGSELFDRHFRSIARFFANKVTDGVEDLVQRTFLACVEGRDRFQGSSSFRTYLFGCAHNILREHIRGRRKAAQVDFGVTSAHDVGPGPSTVFSRQREEKLLLHALRQIPLDHQVVLELFYWEQLSGRELAEVLGEPEGTVRTRLRRGRQLLEEQLAKLADSPALLRTTTSNLEDWARALRDRMTG